jgi:S-adenosylmethionine-diacylglycerol 3-amino-3-carboxypropyl transferase
MNASPSWVVEAAALPLAFAQVREDPRLDLEVIQRIGAGARVLMIASGGCTAAYLASSGLIAHLHLVDLNPAQLALTRLKLHLLGGAAFNKLALMGHIPMPIPERRQQLTHALQELDISAGDLGPLDMIVHLGPDHAGRYERVFAELRIALSSVEQELAALLSLRDPHEQTARAAPDTCLGAAIDRALDDVMALPNLIALFGEGATRNRVKPFARHFARRTRCALASFPASENPYFWQMYRGCYPNGEAAPWFTARAALPFPHISWAQVSMIHALKDVHEDFDFVHLSNILDWLSHEEARATLDMAAAALRPGGWALIRQLNSTLDIAGLGPGFSWHGEEAAAMHARDRSFFYQRLHLGRKR